MSEDIQQRTAEWYAERCGSLGASAIADAISKGKDGKAGATSANLRARLVTERLTGIPAATFKSAAMDHGIETEESARLAYEAFAGCFVSETGIHKHPTIAGTHASPDGLVGDLGLIEIKCPNSTTHIETLKTGKIKTGYIYQMQWQMACTGRDWCDFVSFDPRLPIGLQLFVKRVDYDAALLDKLESEVSLFLEGVADDVKALQAMAGYQETKANDAA